jgi:hypothetical protein
MVVTVEYKAEPEDGSHATEPLVGKENAARKHASLRLEPFHSRSKGHGLWKSYRAGYENRPAKVDVRKQSVVSFGIAQGSGGGADASDS